MMGKLSAFLLIKQPVVTEFYWQDEPQQEKTETEKALEEATDDNIESTIDESQETLTDTEEGKQ